MEIGIIGLGRVGGNIARRLMKAGHSCVIYDANPQAGATLAHEGATAAKSLAALIVRFRSRQQHTFAEKILSAMRFGFGGHVESKDK
jgi:6-phosphogluconate dehydrogenase (decarboxylating)